MKSVCVRRVGLCLLLLGTLTGAQALTVDFKSVTLSAEQRASLKRFLADSSPALSFDWNSLEAHSHSIERERHPLSVSLSTVPALTAAGLCRGEQHHFYFDAAAGKGNGKGNGTGTGAAKGKGRWHANDDLTSLQAWAPQGGACTVVSSSIDVGKSLSDAEFLFIEREKHALRSRAAQVIGGAIARASGTAR
ncbi:MAG: hypothetical protein IPP88_15635 [Betaproteobacteria bacterium]|nr:hypothetical protein [Betaproteobacteria bacterium]